MNSSGYERAATVNEAVRAVAAAPGPPVIAGRTAHVDRMNYNGQNPARCLVPSCGGTLDRAWQEELWAKFSTAARRRRRRCVGP